MNCNRSTNFVLLLLFLLFPGSTFAIEQYTGVRDFGSPVSTQALDLSISLYRPWDQLTPEMQAQYEEILSYCADAVYEMTNGAHYLGKVHILTDGYNSQYADIRWAENLRPNAFIGGFNASNELNINMSDTFSTLWEFPNVDVAAKRRMGYTIAHEMGHNVYSLFDEYSLQEGDVPVEPSIMNYQYHADNGRYQWLNFSTSHNIGDLSKTEQGRLWYMDAWTRLVSENENNWWDRTFYPVLTQYAPTAADNWTDPFGTNTPWVSVELPSNDARKHLEIYWLSSDINIDFILDISGSMAGDKINSLKEQAKRLFQYIYFYTSSTGVDANIGITTFNSSAQNVVDLTELSTVPFHSTIDNLQAGGSTAMYDGCLTSLGKLRNSSESELRIGLLLSDGEINAGNERSITNVTAAYQSSDVVLHTLAYGETHADENLRTLAEETGGNYYANVANEDLFNTWQDVIDQTLNVQFSQGAVFSPATGYSFLIDPTVKNVIVEVQYEVASASDEKQFSVSDNFGHSVASTVSTIAYSDEYPRKEVALLLVDSLAVAQAAMGNWKLSSHGSETGSFHGAVKVIGKNTGTFTVTVTLPEGINHSSNKPVKLRASVDKGCEKVAGAVVTGTITAPSGQVSSVAYYDNGINGDLVANDGIYLAYSPSFTETGAYKITAKATNDEDTAFYAIAGRQYAVSPDGSVHVPTTHPVTTNFVRQASTPLYVSFENNKTLADSVTGFEAAELWSLLNGTGTLASSEICTEGDASLHISGNGWQTIISEKVNTTDIAVNSDSISLDLFVGDRQRSSYWRGSVQISVHCPSANVYQDWIGSEQLNNLPVDEFSIVSFALPQRIKDVFNGNHEDLQFVISLNTVQGTGEYYIDNITIGN